MKSILDSWVAAFADAPLRNAVFLLFVLFLFSLLRKSGRERPTENAAEDTDSEESLSDAEKQGQRGEDAIADILSRTAQGEFELLRNVYVPYGNATAEIDLALIHETGIFVFESKNYGGWIFGSMGGLNWVQRFPNAERRFYNPVRQNRNHIKALSTYLDIPTSRFYSYIVFSDRCALKRVPESGRFLVITQLSRLTAELEAAFAHLPTTYDSDEMQALADRLIPLTNVDPSVREKHIADIRAAWESDVCPFCGGKLVRRRGKYGAFFGCSRYPQCKFKRNMQR